MKTKVEPRRLLSVRIGFCVAIAIVAGTLIALQYTPGHHSDFGQSWFGARSMVHGINPYPLAGRGKPFDYRWGLTYPATAFVPVIPLAWLSEKTAAIIFSAFSAGILAYAVTSKGWHLLPMFLTEPFTNAARLGQWSMLLTAAIFLPWVAALTAVKPQAGIPAIASWRSVKWSICGGIVLLALSLILLPEWPRDWLDVVRAMPDTTPPIMRFGGFLVLSVLYKWRERDAWLILVMSVLPQTPAFYGLLPLLTVPKSLYQSVALAGILTVGAYAGATFTPHISSLAELHSYLGSLHIWIAYLPCVVLVLLRREEKRV